MTKELIQTAGGIIIPPEVRSFGFDDDEGGSSSKSPSGVRINSENAIQCMAVLACVRVLSESLASLPVHIYRRIPGGGKEVFADHPAYKVIHSKPNDWQTSFEFRETLMTHLCLYGNAYCEIVREGRAGVVVALVPLHPSRMDVERLENGTLRYKYTEPSEGGAAGKKAEDVTFYKQGQIMHIRWMSNDSIKGMVPIELAREAIALARACEIHGARFFGGGARPGVVLQTEQSITEESARLIKEFWEKAHRGPWNAHKTAVLTGGLKAEELGGSNADAQFLDSRRYQSEEVCRFYRVPPHMIMDLSRSTFSNIEHQGMDFVTHSLMPWCRRFESVYTRDLLDDPELFIEFDVRGLLRGDASARAAYYNTMFNMGVLSINEIRSFENMNPVAGGDAHYIPLNLAPLGANDPAKEAPEPPQPTADINGIIAVVQQVGQNAVTPDAAQAIFSAVFPQLPPSTASTIIAGAVPAAPPQEPPAAEPEPEPAVAAEPAPSPSAEGGAADNAKRAFCATGKGGGIDNSCSSKIGTQTAFADAPLTAKGAAAWRKRVKAEYDSNPEFKGAVDAATMFTQGDYKEIREVILHEKGLLTTELRGDPDGPLSSLSDPLSSYKNFIEGQDVENAETPLRKAAMALDRAVKDGPPTKEPIYRGLVMPPAGMIESKPNEQMGEWLASVKPGDTMDIDAPVSFSANAAEAEKFATGTSTGQGKNKVKVDGVIIEVEPGARGLPVAALSPWKNQAEVLSSGRFEVVSVEGTRPQASTKSGWDYKNDREQTITSWGWRGEDGVQMRIRVRQIDRDRDNDGKINEGDK